MVPRGTWTTGDHLGLGQGRSRAGPFLMFPVERSHGPFTIPSFLPSMRHRAILFVLCSTLSLFMQAQSCTLVLDGRVLDEHDRTPLAFAALQIVGTSLSVEADDQGRFRFTGVCPGRVVVRVAHVDCDPQERVFNVVKDRTVELFLEHHAGELHELEVARARPDEQVGRSSTELDAKAVHARAADGLAAVVAQVPGVTVLNSGPTIGKPVIHGFSGNRVLVLDQGVRQEDQQWGTEHAPNLDPLSGERITVIKGAASVQYGADAIGGVIISEPVELPQQPGLSGEVGAWGRWNGRGGGASAKLQGGVRGVRGLGWRVQGSGRAVGDSRSPGYVLSNTGLREGAVSLAAGWRRYDRGVDLYYSYFQRELGILRTAHIGNLTDLQNAIRSGKPWYTAPFTYAIDAPRQQVGHHLLKVEGRHNVGERGRITASYAYQADARQEYDLRRAGRSAIPALDLFLSTHAADAVYKHHIGQLVHGKAGVAGTYQQNTNVPGTGVRPLIPNYRKSTGAVFVVEHLPVSAKLELEAGARMELTGLDVFRNAADGAWAATRRDFRNHALSAGGNWSVRDSVRLRFNVSSAFRPPHVSELYSEGLHHGSAAVEIGDPALGPEHAWTAMVELSAVLPNGRGGLDLTLHASRVANYIQLLPDGEVLTIRGAFPVFRYASTDASLHGFDATAWYRFLPSWTFRSRWSVLRARDLALDRWLFQMPGDRTENTVLYTRERLGRWNALQIGVISTTVLVQTRVPPGVDLMDPPPSYHLLGLTAGISRPLRKGTLHLALDGYNLLDQRYRDIMDRWRYYADARGADITVRLRYTFGV